MQVMRHRSLLVSLAVAGSIMVVATGCASRRDLSELAKLACSTGQCKEPAADVFIGLSKPDGRDVSDREWETFVAQYVAPRAGNGLAFVDRHGQRHARSTKPAGPCNEVVLLCSWDATATSSIEAIRSAYRQTFQQECVVQVSSSPGLQPF